MLDVESEKDLSAGKVTIKGFATIDNVCLINIEGTGMVGVPGKAGSYCSSAVCLLLAADLIAGR